MGVQLSSFLSLALAAAVLPQCHGTADDRGHGAAMTEVDDLNTDDVGAVRQRYSTLAQASASTMTALKKALEHDPRVRVRANAATALDALPIMDIFGKGAFEQNRRDIRRSLIRALDDAAPAVQARAANALALHDLADGDAREALQKHVPQLRAAVASPDERVADDALWALRTMEVPLPLEALLRSSSERFRETGIEQAGIAPDPAVLPLIAQLALKDPAPTVRKRAIQVVATQEPPAERDRILGQLLDDQDDQVAAEAANAAARVGATGVSPHLRQLVERPAGDARLKAAIHALAKLGDRASVPAIARHLNDEPTARGEASLALDVLVGPPRAYTEWQAWARQQGYLR
jgi:HEAT repeat protein